MNCDFLKSHAGGRKKKEYIHYLNKLNDELLEVDLVETGKILHLIDLEKIFSSDSQIVKILAHKTEKKNKKNKSKKFYKQELSEITLKNYSDNLVVNSPQTEKGKNNVNNIAELQETINDLIIYKEVVKFIAKDVYNETHLLYELRISFSNYFLHKYDKILKSKEEKTGEQQIFSEISKNIKKALFDLQQFIRLYLEIIYLFYGIRNILNETNNPIFSLKNLSYFLILHVFSPNIYKIIYDLFMYENEIKEKKLQSNIEFFRDINNLKLFGIPKKYCIDSQNVDSVNNMMIDQSMKNTAHFNLIHKESYSGNESEREYFFSAKNSLDRVIFLSVYSFGGRNISQEDLDQILDNTNIKENSFVYRDLSEYSNSEHQDFYEVNTEENKNSENIDQTPKDSNLSLSEKLKTSKSSEKSNTNSKFYFFQNKEKYFVPAITSLESICSVKSPLNKIKVLKKTIQKIYFCIHSFYKENNLTLPNELDHFEIIAIFLYVIIKSNVINFFAECAFIENFTLCNIFESIGGYYYVIFRIILEFFAEIDVSKIDLMEKENFFQDFCQQTMEKIKDPDEKTKNLIMEIKKNVHKNYKSNI